MPIDVERQVVAKLHTEEVLDLLTEAGVKVPATSSLAVRVRGERSVEVKEVHSIEFVVVEDDQAAERLDQLSYRIRKLQHRLRRRLSRREWKTLLDLEATTNERQAFFDRLRRTRNPR